MILQENIQYNTKDAVDTRRTHPSLLSVVAIFYPVLRIRWMVLYLRIPGRSVSQQGAEYALTSCKSARFEMVETPVNWSKRGINACTGHRFVFQPEWWIHRILSYAGMRASLRLHEVWEQLSSWTTFLPMISPFPTLLSCWQCSLKDISLQYPVGYITTDLSLLSILRLLRTQRLSSVLNLLAVSKYMKYTAYGLVKQTSNVWAKIGYGVSHGDFLRGWPFLFI